MNERMQKLIDLRNSEAPEINAMRVAWRTHRSRRANKARALGMTLEQYRRFGLQGKE